MGSEVTHYDFDPGTLREQAEAAAPIMAAKMNAWFGERAPAPCYEDDGPWRFTDEYTAHTDVAPEIGVTVSRRGGGTVQACIADGYERENITLSPTQARRYAAWLLNAANLAEKPGPIHWPAEPDPMTNYSPRRVPGYQPGYLERELNRQSFFDGTATLTLLPASYGSDE